MIIALDFPHADGRVSILVTGPEFESENLLADGYEVDAKLTAFDTISEAEQFLADRGVDVVAMESVPGGRILDITY